MEKNDVLSPFLGRENKMAWVCGAVTVHQLSSFLPHYTSDFRTFPNTWLETLFVLFQHITYSSTLVDNLFLEPMLQNHLQYNNTVNGHYNKSVLAHVRLRVGVLVEVPDGNCYARCNNFNNTAYSPSMTIRTFGSAHFGFEPRAMQVRNFTFSADSRIAACQWLVAHMAISG